MKDFEIVNNLQSFKHAHFREASGAAIEIGKKTALVPIGNWILSEAELLESMTIWRSMNMEFFFSRFESSIESTKEYLAKYSISEKNRLLFLVMHDSNALGHLGVSGVIGDYAEIDNVIKSPKWGQLQNAPSMRDCIQRMMEWSNSTLGVRYFGLRVLSSNMRAIRLYSNLGFSISQSIPVIEDPKSDWGSLIEAKDSQAEQSLRMLSMDLDLENSDRFPMN